MALEVSDSPDPADVDVLEHQIRDDTLAATGQPTAVELAVLDRDPDGELVGGAYGFTWGGTFDLLHLWVRADRRRRGRGAALLEAAEAVAAGRGCTQVVLLTHASQSRTLYARRGYEVVGRVPDYPAGDEGLWLRKDLAPDA